MTISSSAARKIEQKMIQNALPLVQKWRPILESEDAPELKTDFQKYVAAKLLETSLRQLKAEATQTTTVFGNNYVPAMLGMTLQSFGQMWSQELVSIQPMSLPSGQIFHLTTSRDDDTSDGIGPYEPKDSVGFTELQSSSGYADFAGAEGTEITTGMKLAITQSNVTIDQVKKLRTSASMELETDLQAVHNISAVDVLESAATGEIARELDSVNVAAIKNAAIQNGTVTFGEQPEAGYPVDKWRFELQTAINRAMLHVMLKSDREPNRMIVGNGAYERLLNLNAFIMDPNVRMDGGRYGLIPVGQLKNGIQVYRTNNLPAMEILLGAKGTGFLDDGIVFAPYVLLFISERVFNVTHQKWDQSFASRYTVETMSVNPYARVVIDPAATGVSDVVTP